MIRIENISVTFHSRSTTVHAVRNASLTIKRGEIFGIVGTSGAGKSTLLRTINMLEKPDNGSIRIDENEITTLGNGSLRKARQRIGMVFQHFNLVHTKTIYDNVALAMKIAGKSPAEIKSRVPELLSIVGLSDKASSYPSQLSGGQKQRVGIARALANRPELLLCDEPTSALDLETTRSILELLRNINTRFGITIVIITHEMDVIKSICSRVAVMSFGEIVEVGDAYDIFARPQHEVTRQLVHGSLNLSLPENISGQISGTLLKIVYHGGTALDPVLTDAIRTFPVRINILHGRIEYIAGQPLGILLINITADNHGDIVDAIRYFKDKTSNTEVINGTVS